MPISLSELQDALMFVSVEAMEDHGAIIDRECGKIYFWGEIPGLDERPKDSDDDTKYVSVPNRQELGLGLPLVLRFAREAMPDDTDEIRAIFNRKGAFRRFKSFLERRGALERWYEFSHQAEIDALRAWCADKKIEFEE